MENEKPTYEELENRVNYLIQRVQELQNQLTQISNLNNTLHWLFKLVENKEVFNESVVKKVVNKLENILTPPDDESNE